MRITLAYLQENEGESSRPKTRNPPLQSNYEVGHNQLVNDYIVDDASMRKNSCVCSGLVRYSFYTLLMIYKIDFHIFGNKLMEEVSTISPQFKNVHLQFVN